MSSTTTALKPIKEVMQDLGGLSRTTLYRLFDAGELTRVNIGARAFVTVESVEAYIDRLKAAAARQAEQRRAESEALRGASA